MKNTNRRTFLKAVAAGTVAATLPPPSFAAEPAQSASDPATRHASPTSSLLNEVNILQGADSSSLFSRGNTLPIVAMPFGMAHWTLQTVEQGDWFFHPNDRRLQGVRCTHQLSPWLGDYGNATFLPIGPTESAEPSRRSSSYRPELAKLSPNLLAIRLLRYRADIELAPTVRGAMLQVTFDDLPGREAGLAIDLPGSDAQAILDSASGVVHCSTTSSSGGTPENFRTHYAIQFGSVDDRVVLRLDETTTRSGRTIVARYRTEPHVPMPIRIATSFISREQAMRNLKTELQPHTFDQIKADAKGVWNDHLGRAAVEGATPDQRRVFYSAMYRALLFPRTWHELDADHKPIHFSAFNGKVESGVMYADHGYWDVYRAWYPWMSILFPDRLGEILQAWVNAAREGGWLPQFPSPGYRACMTGSLIDAVFADAAVKQVKGFDLPEAYAALKKHATTPGSPEHGYGRRGVEFYLKLGYVPYGRIEQSVAETVDAAYGDFCIAQMAALLGYKNDAAMFLERSGNWRHLFDSGTGFLRGKTEDGNWVTPFNPVRWGDPYVEGSAWQHRWDVPQDFAALFDAMGGREKAIAHLEQMLTMPPDFDTGSYGGEIHEMSEMAAVDFGQYAHSNQPVHHVLYLFALAGRPDRTQFWVRRVLQTLYSPQGFAGDEDTGSMAAWYLMSAMGFYPATPGKPEYVLGAPLFDRVELKLPGEKTLIIKALDNAPDRPFVSAIRLNGKLHGAATISHEDLMRGGSLQFTMSAHAHVG
jgi:predicted alpha-1,2-mannosidase